MSGIVLSETRYMPFGAVRTDVGTISQTDFGYTFQRNLPDTGLMDYRARFYDPYINRFIQPDSIIPGASNPQSWNRFAYTLNNPLRYIDPTGHYVDEGCGSGELCELPPSKPDEIIKDPNDNENDENKRQDELFTLIFVGSGPNGSWTNSDWLRYISNRSRFWSNPELWDPNGPSGWNLFQLHVQRLVSNYAPEQRDQFMRDFGLVFAGIPSQPSFVSAALSVRYGPSDLQYLSYTNDGLPKNLWDGENPNLNQSHHYAGIFVLSYFTGPNNASFWNTVRDIGNTGDVSIGNIAAGHGFMYFLGVDMDQINDMISSVPLYGR